MLQLRGFVRVEEWCPGTQAYSRACNSEPLRVPCTQRFLLRLGVVFFARTLAFIVMYTQNSSKIQNILAHPGLFTLCCQYRGGQSTLS